MQSIEPRDYSYEISSLEKLIMTIQSNVNFTITIIVGLLALAVGISGWALATLVKLRVEKSVEKELGIIEEKVKKLLKDNPQILWANGKGALTSSSRLGDVSPAYRHEYQVVGLNNYSKEDVIYIDAYYIQEGKKISIDDYNILLMDNGVKVYVIEDLGTLNPNIQVHVFILWSNPKLKNS